jgi:hypothetical protein
VAENETIEAAQEFDARPISADLRADTATYWFACSLIPKHPLPLVRRRSKSDMLSATDQCRRTSRYRAMFRGLRYSIGYPARPEAMSSEHSMVLPLRGDD